MDTVRFVDLGSQLVRAVRGEIVAGVLAPGERLVETTLSERFDVSRGPVRDALRELESEGLVESSRRGTFVVGLSSRDISELYSLRGTLEAFAYKLVQGARDADWETQDRCINTMTDAADRGDARTFADADLRFHRAMLGSARHRRLMLVWEQMEPTFRALLDFTNAQDRDLHPALASHRTLLACVREGRLPEALDELRTHLDGSQARIVAARAERIGSSPTAGEGT